MQFILSLGTMLAVAFLFTKIRGFIKNRVFNQLKKRYNGVARLDIKKKLPNISEQEIRKDIEMALNSTRGLNASIGRSYKKDKGAFSFKKFKDNFTVTKEEGKKWGKTLGWWINWRNWAVVGFIVAAAFAYGHFKGQGNTPIQIDLDYTKEFRMKLDSHFLVKPKNSENIRIEDKNGNVIKNIKAKDFPLLAKKLKPIGFILEPVGIVGTGAGGKKKGVEYGAGVSFIKYWKWKLDGFLTNRGIYVGTSYQITDNTGLGLGAGKGYAGDNRIIFYGRVGF